VCRALLGRRRPLDSGAGHADADDDNDHARPGRRNEHLGTHVDAGGTLQRKLPGAGDRRRELDGARFLARLDRRARFVQGLVIRRFRRRVGDREPQGFASGQVGRRAFPYGGRFRRHAPGLPRVSSDSPPG